MKSKSFKKVIVTILVLSMMTTSPVNAYMITNAEQETSTETTVDTSGEDAQGEEEYQADAVDEDFVARDEAKLLKSMTKLAENSNFALYINENEEDDEDLLALENKSNGFVWWSSPVNAMGDVNATNTLRQDLKSALSFTYGKPADRTTSNQRSAKNGKSTYKMIDTALRLLLSSKRLELLFQCNILLKMII